MEVSKLLWKFEGDYTFKEMPKYLDQLSVIEIKNSITLDFSGAINIDTSILSLIFEIKRKVKLSGQKVKLNQIPKNIKDLASLYGVDQYLN